jgi:hypothetical protein
MTDTDVTSTLGRPRWGEGVLLAASAPGMLAAAVLALGLALARLGWQPELGPLTYPLALLAICSPLLVLLGTATLIGGALAVRRVPGRSPYKWGILIAGILTWGLAAYWLSVPGLIDLPYRARGAIEQMDAADEVRAWPDGARPSQLIHVLN